MYSLNAPVPGDVAAMASDLAAAIPSAYARPRGEHSLLLKRLQASEREEFHRCQAQVREELAGTEPFEVTVTGLDWFEQSTSGSSPVVYLAVDSPEGLAVHHRLCEAMGAIPELEGEDFTPHVTVARGGDHQLSADLLEREIEPVTWEVTELLFWDAHRSVPAGRLSLPV